MTEVAHIFRPGFHLVRIPWIEIIIKIRREVYSELPSYFVRLPILSNRGHVRVTLQISVLVLRLQYDFLGFGNPQGSSGAASRFPVEPDYEEFDRDDPTARARVGPSPQLAADGDANYTVIYNFASPTPKRRRDGYAAGKSRKKYQF